VDRVLLCVSGSTLGRSLLSLTFPKFSTGFLKRRKKEELEFCGEELSGNFGRAGSLFFSYTVRPLPRRRCSRLREVAKVKGDPHRAGLFFGGKFLSDALMLFTGFTQAELQGPRARHPFPRES